MTSYVRKANNAYKAVPQRDAINEVLNLEMKDDASIDFDDMLRNHPEEFKIIVNLVCYQITGNSFYISPTEVYVRVAKKFETLFAQLEEPIFLAIKNAVHSGENYRALHYFNVRSFFLSRALLSDVPEAKREKVLLAAKIAHGDDYDTRPLEANEAHLNTILERTGYHSVYFFKITTFEFENAG